MYMPRVTSSVHALPRKPNHMTQLREKDSQHNHNGRPRKLNTNHIVAVSSAVFAYLTTSKPAVKLV